jgi:hypothetical protein
MIDIYKTHLSEMVVVYPGLSQESALKILIEKLNEIIVQFEILKEEVNKLKKKTK